MTSPHVSRARGSVRWDGNARCFCCLNPSLFVIGPWASPICADAGGTNTDCPDRNPTSSSLEFRGCEPAPRTIRQPSAPGTTGGIRGSEGDGQGADPDGSDGWCLPLAASSPDSSRIHQGRASLGIGSGASAGDLLERQPGDEPGRLLDLQATGDGLLNRDPGHRVHRLLASSLSRHRALGAAPQPVSLHNPARNWSRYRRQRFSGR